MSSNHSSTATCRQHGSACVRFFALLALSLFGSAVAADDHDVAHRYLPAIDLHAASYYQYRDGKGDAYAAVGTELSIELLSSERPFAAGLFAEFDLTTRENDRFSQLVGGWARYRYGRWELSSMGAQFDSSNSKGLWMYASKLQFNMRPEHKIALTAVGAIGGSRGPSVQLVYKTVLAGRTSLSVAIGLGSNRAADFGASTKLVWNLH